MIAQILRGVTLGFSSGVAPGPFQAYLFSQSLKHGWQRTLPAAFAPLCSDGIIIATVLLVLTRTPDGFLRVLKISGGLLIVFLAWRAYRTFRAPPQEWRTNPGNAQQSFLEAILMNFLNPNPWIFWSTISGPILIEGWRISPTRGIAFLVGFYVTLVSVFALFIVLFATARQLGPRLTRVFSGISALALFLFGLFQLWSGLTDR